LAIEALFLRPKFGPCMATLLLSMDEIS
jgi:hypothetical protein